MTTVTWTHPTYETIVRLLGERTGLCFSPNRHDSAELGIRRAMARAGVTDPNRYRDRIETETKALDDLVMELTVGETYFFREPAQFEFIRREVLPEIRRRRGGEHGVRAWSAGCASGEEAYSLAILFDEEGLAEGAYLLATDISRAALAKARGAAYGAWSLRGEGAPAAAPYLRRRGDRQVLDDKFRRRVVFEHLNLALDVYPSFATGTWGMDLILCRNVLIYLDRQTVRRVARRLFESLAPGGWLITASSDPPLGDDAPYATVATSAGVFYRRDEGAAVHPPLIADLRLQIADLQKSADSHDEQPARPATQDYQPGRPVPQSQICNLQSAISFTPTPPVAALSTVVQPGLGVLAEARDALARGDYARANGLTRSLEMDPAASALRVQALANLDTTEAERVCAEATSRHSLSTELHYLHSVLLMDLGRNQEAAQAARRVLYLDRSLAVAHFTLGAILCRCGDRVGARRAYRNARDLCATRPSDEVVPLSDGEHAVHLAEAAAAQLAALEATVGVPS